MIEIECLNSPLIDQIGLFRFIDNEILISKLQESHFVTQMSHPISIQVNSKGLFLINPKGDKEVLINSKFCEELNKLKENDIVSLKNYSFQIKNFQLTSEKKLKDILNIRTQELINSKSDILNIIETIKSRDNDV